MEPKNYSLITLLVLIGGFIGMFALQGIALTAPSATGGGTLTTYRIKVSGSTTCFPVIENASIYYMDTHSNFQISVSSGGSGAGVDDLAAGITDIGMTSRPIKSSEYSEHSGTDILQWKDWKFAKDGVTIIANDNIESYWQYPSKTPNMTLATIFYIYNGTYTSWNEVPGFTGVPSGDETIVPFTREGGSGTRETFEKYVKTPELGELEDDSNYKTVVTTYDVADGNPAMSQQVTDTDSSIGYVGLAYVDSTTQMSFSVAVNSTSTPIVPSQATILDASYPISRFLHLWTTPDATTGTMQFIDFLYSPQGQNIVLFEGYVPLYDISVYDF